MINKIIAEEKIQQVRKLLEKKEKIVITCHVSPDGDAIGASLGLYHFLDGLGKEVNVVVPDLLPRNLLFLKGTKEIVVYTRYPEFAEKLMRLSLYSVWILMLSAVSTGCKSLCLYPKRRKSLSTII